ncbi:MAG: hypothetical protein C0598_08690 [Marinilabiliales bacterium]|nr:MAG: hypothetical protein C0598_08690 [Marinilabiliales bacterium]
MKRIAVLLFALALSTTMFGQFHFGPQIGYTASNISMNTDDIKNNLKSSFTFGVFVRMGNKIYLQPEVNWMTQGSVFKYPSISLDGVNLSPVEQEINLRTINVPLTLGWRIIDLKLVNIRIFGGVNTNIVVNKEINTTDEDNSIGQDLITPIQDSDIKDMVWNYHVGAGVDVLMFALDVKYVGAFGEPIVSDISYNNETRTVGSKSSMFLVTLGWKIF